MIRYDQFLQSSDWASFQRALGHQVIETEYGFVYLRKMRFGLSNYYLPRTDITSEQLENIEKSAKEAGADFVRLDPRSVNKMSLDKVGYRKVSDMQPSTTLVMDLSQNEEEMLAGMHSKTRYNIRLAEKKGVTVSTSKSERFEEFWKLLESTYDRKNIASFDKNYYQTLLAENNGAYLAFAEYEGEPIVGQLMIKYGDAVTYLHGGSDKEFRKLMAPQLLQWEEIKRAKRDGFLYYDFWGIAPEGSVHHPLAGVTRFKTGFGGVVVNYPGTYEKGIRFTYPIYRLLSRIR